MCQIGTVVGYQVYKQYGLLLSFGGGDGSALGLPFSGGFAPNSPPGSFVHGPNWAPGHLMYPPFFEILKQPLNIGLLRCTIAAPPSTRSIISMHWHTTVPIRTGIRGLYEPRRYVPQVLWITSYLVIISWAKVLPVGCILKVTHQSKVSVVAARYGCKICRRTVPDLLIRGAVWHKCGCGTEALALPLSVIFHCVAMPFCG